MYRLFFTLAVLMAVLFGPALTTSGSIDDPSGGYHGNVAEADTGDVWSIGTGLRKVRFVSASPSGVAIVGASPGALALGTTGLPVKAVISDLLVTGTYSLDDIGAANNLTVGNNIVTAGNIISTGPFNTSKTATVGNLVTSGAGNVGHATANNLTATNASITRVAYGSGVINATNFVISTTPNATYFVTNTNAQNITLPDPAAIPTNMPITIVDAAGQAGTNTIAVNSTAGNVGGAAFVNISTNYASKTYRSNGANWFAQ